MNKRTIPNQHKLRNMTLTQRKSLTLLGKGVNPSSKRLRKGTPGAFGKSTANRTIKG